MDLQIEFDKLNTTQEKILDLLKRFKNSPDTISGVYSLDQLAKLFKVTTRTIYNWKDRGILPCTIIGSKTYITEAQLREFLKVHEVKPLISGRI